MGEINFRHTQSVDIVHRYNVNGLEHKLEEKKTATCFVHGQQFQTVYKKKIIYRYIYGRVTAM